MTNDNAFFSQTKLNSGQKVDFEGIYKKLRQLAPKCPRCNGYLEDPNAGHFKKTIRLEDNTTTHICALCFYDDVGEALLNDTPH